MYSNNHYDELEPRPMPRPTEFQEVSARPEVPELSIVFDSLGINSKPTNGNPHTTNQITQETYSEWKNRQNRPIYNEPRYYEPRDKHYYGSSAFSESDQNPHGRFSDRMSYKSGSDYHKCACQNSPTVKDIYNMMKVHNDQTKCILETIHKLLATVLSKQENQHKCCCSMNHCFKRDNVKTIEISEKNEIQEKYPSKNSNDKQIEKPPSSLKNDEIIQKKNEPTKCSKCSYKPDNTSETKDKSKKPMTIKCNNSNNEKKEKERTYSIQSDESFDLNSNDVQVTEATISPEQSIHIEMASSSENSSNSDEETKTEEENNKKIEVGWTIYQNIMGQVNNLLEDNKNKPNSEVVEPTEHVKTTIMTKPKNFEPYKNFILPESNKIDSSLQMQALAMQYLSPEQALKFDMNKHFVPTTQPPIKSPNNYSISTMHYMERYQLIGPEQNYDNPQHKSTEGIQNEKKKSSRKSKTPSKIHHITELKQLPK